MDIDTFIILRGHVTLSDHIVQTVVDLCSLHSRKEACALLSRASKLCSCLCYQSGVARTLQSRGRRSASHCVIIHVAPAVTILTAASRTRVLARDTFISGCSLLKSECPNKYHVVANKILNIHLEHCEGLPALQSKIHHAGEMESRGSFSRK